MSFLCVNPLPFALAAGLGIGNDSGSRTAPDEILSARASLLSEFYNANFASESIVGPRSSVVGEVAQAVLKFAAALPRGQLGAVSKTAAAVNTVFPGRAAADSGASAASALSPRRLGGGTVALESGAPGSPAAAGGEHAGSSTSDAARLQRSTALALASADAAAQREFVMANLQSLLTRLAAQEHARLRVAVALRLLLLVGFSLPPVPHGLRGPAPSSTVGSAAPSRLPSARSGGGGLGSWRDGRRGSTGSASSDELEEAKDGGSTPAEAADGAGSRRLSFGTATAAATQLSAAAAALLQTPALLSDIIGPGGAATAAAFSADMVASAMAAVRDRLAASPPFPATLAAAALGASVGAPAAPLTLSHSGSFATLLAQSHAGGAGTLSLSRAFPMEAAFSAALHHAASATAATPSSAGAPLSAAGMGIGGFASIASPGGVGGASSGAGSIGGSAAPRSPAAAASLSKSHSAFSISLRGASDSMGGAGAGAGAGGGAGSASAAAAAVGLLSRTMSNPYASVSTTPGAAVLSLAAFRCLSDVDDGIGWAAGDGDGTEPESPAELTDAAGAGAPAAPPLQLHILVSGAARSTVLLPAAALGQLLTCLPSRLLRRYPGLASMVDAAAAASCPEDALLRLQSCLQLHVRIEDVSDASVYAPLPAVATAIVRAATRSCVAVAPSRIFAGVDFAEASTLAVAAAAVTVRNALDVGLHLRVRGGPAASAAPAVLAHGELRALRLAPYGASYAGLPAQALAAGVLSSADVAASVLSSSSLARAEGKDSAADGKADGAPDGAAAFCRVAVAGSPSAVARVLQSAGARNAATGVVSASTLVRLPPSLDASSSSSSSSSDASEAMALAVLDVMRASATHATDASDAAPPIALLPPAAFVPFSCAVPGPHPTDDLASAADNPGPHDSLPLPTIYEKSLSERRLRAAALQASMASDSTAAVETSSRMLQLAVQAAFTDWIAERCANEPALRAHERLRSINKVSGASAPGLRLAAAEGKDNV